MADRRSVAGALVSLGFVAVVVWWARRQDAPRFPADVGGWSWLLAALGLYAVITTIRGWRWDRVLNHAGVRHRRQDAYGLVVVGYAGNTVLPARAGDLLRLVLLSARSAAGYRQALGAIIPERLLDASALAVLLAALTLLGAAGAPAGAWPGILAGVGVAAATGALLFYLRLRRRGRFETFAARLRPVAAASKVLVGPVGAALLVVSCGIWLLEGTVLTLCSRAVGVDLALEDATYCVILASLVALVPAAPGYLGTFDAALLFVLDRLGVMGGDAVGLTLLYRFIIFVPITVVGLSLLATRYGGMRTLRLARRSAPAP